MNPAHAFITFFKIFRMQRKLNPEFQGSQAGAWLKPLAKSGLMPLQNNSAYAAFQDMLSHHLILNPGYWSDKVVKKLLQNMRDIAKEEIAHASNMEEKERILGLRRYLNGIIIWLSRRTRLENLNRILPILTESQAEQFKHRVISLTERDLGLDSLPSVAPEQWELHEDWKPNALED